MNVDNKQSVIAKFFVEIHIIDNFKINLLVNNNVFNTQKVILNLKTQTVILVNCCNLIILINITVKKNINQQRIVRSKIDF